MIWKHRHWIAHHHEDLPASSLSILARAYRSTIPKEVREIRRLCVKFSTLPPTSALLLLDGKYSDPIIRLFAVQRIASM